MTALSVNLNKVALVRNARAGARPSVRAAAEACLRAGAGGLTMHPRPDGRHALASDVRELAALVAEARAAGRDAELNVEGNPFEVANGVYPEVGGFPGFVGLVEWVRPTQATLVPDAPGQRTSDHGWDFERDGERLQPVVAELQAMGCRVSLFVEADAKAIEGAHAVGADRVELYTGPYAEAFSAGHPEALLPRYAAAAQRAHALGLGVNAGHDLDLDNLTPFLRAVPGVAEVSIGHALVADALDVGLERAVGAYLAAIVRAKQRGRGGRARVGRRH